MFAAGEEEFRWEADTALIAEDDDRTRILIAQPVFRLRFAAIWPMAQDDDDDDED